MRLRRPALFANNIPNLTGRKPTRTGVYRDPYRVDEFAGFEGMKGGLRGLGFSSQFLSTRDWGGFMEAGRVSQARRPLASDAGCR